MVKAKFDVGDKVKLSRRVPEHFVLDDGLSRSRTYSVAKVEIDYSMKPPRRAYTLKDSSKRVMKHLVFYSYDLDDADRRFR